MNNKDRDCSDVELLSVLQPSKLLSRLMSFLDKNIRGHFISSYLLRLKVAPYQRSRTAVKEENLSLYLQEIQFGEIL